MQVQKKGLYLYSGGGSYDQEGNQKKIGKWVDLNEGFSQKTQVTYNGEYNKIGKKVGRWDIIYGQPNEMKYNQIGGGSYDQEGNQKKVGKWVELIDGFCYVKQATFNGEYDMKGQKVGIWVVMDIEKNKKIREQGYDA